jgi:CheY-like chemotaxis protein
LLHAEDMTVAGSGRQAYVLIADGHVKLANNLAKALAAKGLHAQVVHNGAAVLDRLEQAARDPAIVPLPDLVVCDSGNSKCDGVGIMNALRNRTNPLSVTPSFLLMTDARDPSLLERALRLGAAGVLRKPFQLEDFVSEVLALLGGAQRTGSTGRSQGTGSAP